MTVEWHEQTPQSLITSKSSSSSSSSANMNATSTTATTTTSSATNISSAFSVPATAAAVDDTAAPIICNDVFINLSDYQSVRPLIHRVFPAWAHVPVFIDLASDAADQDPSQQNNSVITAKAATVQSTDKVVVKRLTGGITNVLFQATYFHYPTYVPSAPAPVPLNNSTTTADDDTNSTNTATSSYAASTASTVVDDEDTLTRPQEFVFWSEPTETVPTPLLIATESLRLTNTFTLKNLAPQLYARFGNGLVYAYLPGRAVHYTLLSDDDVAVAIARRLAEWHDLLDAKAIDNHIALLKGPGKSFVRSFWELLDGWIAAMPENVIKTHTKEEMNKELQWIKQEIGQMGGPMVVAHCDLLAGNVIVPTDWEPRKKTTSDNQNDISDLDVSFIDYEYAMNSPRAFDIANHFMEWQGFDCKKELIPVPEETNPVLRTWARDYLSYFSSSSEDISEVDTLVKQVLTWWGMPGFYWGIWSSIQSTISDIEFDYANYANERLAEYWEWKKRYLNKHS